MSSLRPELHVAQQIRRDKLRIQNSSSSQQFPSSSNIEHLSLHPGFNLDEAASLYPSEEMISFSTPSNPLPAPAPAPPSGTSSSRLMMPHYGASFPHSSSPTIIHNSSPKVCDWMVNYATTSNPNTFLPTSELNNNNNNNNNSVASSGEIQKQLGEMHCPSSSSSPPQLYHNALQDIFKSTSNSITPHGSEMASSLMHHHGIWGGNININNTNTEPILHGGANVWTNRAVDYSTLRWNNHPLGNFTDKKIDEQDLGSVLRSDCNNPHQGLSLSLSSNSQSKPSSGSHNFEQEKSIMKPPPIMPNFNSSSGYRNVGPLGPFTGYATILKSSRFLRPCQQLLDECCCQSGQRFAKSCGGDNVPAEWVSRDVGSASTSSAAVNVDESGVIAAKGGGSNSGASSSSVFYASKENSSDIGGGAASNFCLSNSRPECQKHKAKLLYMQEEVTRRYKQYHQQMQMVVSSFETVAGLSSATPYVSLALKSVSRHFRCLKNAISDQLKLTCEVLGEEFSIPTTSTSNKIDNNVARLRSMEHSFQKNKSGGGNIDFLEQQQQHHVWRPQRGLPERSVAILKAWLFEHFLHPYPTDTDKHMLATQTGLSRNQVSNWFINARVRVWKPMVEEIHMLETKGTTEPHQQKNEVGASASEGNSSQLRVDHHQPMKQFHCLEMGSSSSAGNIEEKGGTDHIEQQWNQEKRSKLERGNITPNNMDGTVMGFMPYRRGGGGSGLEVAGGLGSVSLTLGLRHGVEGVQHQQLQQEEELRRQFGGHMIHDFVG